VIERGIHAFVSREWEAVRRSKDEYWAERIARLGPAESFRIAEELRQQAMLQHPGWPHPSDRREDILAHERLAALMSRAG
jgi:hypothetical protein